MWVYAEHEPAIKLAMLAIALIIALRFTPKRIPFLRLCKRRLNRLSHHPWKCAAILFCLSVVLSATLSAMRTPLPWVHDEFANLLASETFAAGRLTNPAHPLWEHFESFHILSQPSRTAKYPPAPTLFMALGQRVTGQPITGVWFALALASVACYWMLRAVTKPQWALWGGLLVTANGWLLHAWGQSYWGGAVAFLGGALAYGGIRRIVRDGKLVDAILCGFGLLLLANSRPMEGCLVSLPLFGVLAWWLFRGTENRTQSQRSNTAQSFASRLTRVILPMVLIGGLGLAAMGMYNQAVTGHASKMPYQVHDGMYSASTMIIWKQPPDPPFYNHRRMEKYFLEFGRQRQLSLRNWDTYFVNLSKKFALVWSFYPFGFGLAFLAIPAIWKDRWIRGGLITIAVLILIQTQLASSWMFPHYLAPAAAMFFAINLSALRYLRTCNRESKMGALIVRFVLIYSLLKLVPVFVSYAKPIRVHSKQAVEQQLNIDPQPDLVIVSYDPNYRISNEWVYNEADIDNAPIVFARDMGAEKNAELFEYFANRKIWRWHLVDDENEILEEY